MTTANFRLAVFAFGLIILAITETIFPARKWTDNRPKRMALHLSIAMFNSLILKFIAIAPLIAFQNFVLQKQWGLFPALNITGPTQIITAIILFDLFDYIWHRMSHRTKFLWRFHKVHHVDTHVDVTTSLRFHIGELTISSLFKALWILAAGPTIWTFAIFEALLTLSSQFHHSNIDFPDPIENLARVIIVTPRYHAAHHTVSKRTGDQNFSAIFIFWDKLFGSYRIPDYQEMKYLGLNKGRDTYLSFLSALKGPLTKDY